MKTMIRFLSLVALAAAAALPAFAQNPAPAPAAQDICTEQARTDLYTKYYNDKKGDAAAQKQAFDEAQQYLQKYGTCNDQYTKAVQKFVDAYLAAKNQLDLPRLIFSSTPDYAKGFETGRQILARDPNDVSTLMILGYGGYQAQAFKNDSSYSADALADAKRAIQLIESGKTPANWQPFSSKDEALGYLNYSIAELTYQPTNPTAATATAALPYYLKAATYESPVKKSAVTYGRIAAAYQAGQYNQMQQAFNTKFGNKPETDESKFELDQLNQVIDRIIDAYARAVNLAGSDPKLAQPKAAWNEQLTNFYKFRHDNKTDGLDAFIASVVNTPLPAPYEPKPYVPPATPATGTTSGDGASGTKPPATEATPAPTQPSTTNSTKPGPTAKKPPMMKHHG